MRDRWVFIQTIRRGDIDRVLDLCVEAGCNPMLRFGHAWGDPANPLKNPPDRVIEAARRAEARGLSVAAWGWPHPDHLESYFETLEAATEGWTPAFWCDDVEHSKTRTPWKNHPQKEERAEQLISMHTERGHRPLCITTYGAAMMHGSLPYAQLLPPGVAFMGQWQTVDLALMERSLGTITSMLGREPIIWPCGGLHREHGSADPKSRGELTAHSEDLDRAFGLGRRAWWTIERLDPTKKQSDIRLASVLRSVG